MKLTPIQRLYLLSFENKEVWCMSNALICLIYESTKEGKIKFKDNKFKIIGVLDCELLDKYLEDFIILLHNKMYYELFEYLQDLNFIPFSRKNGYIKVSRKLTLLGSESITPTEKLFEENKKLKDNDLFMDELILSNYKECHKLTNKILPILKEFL